MNDRWPAELEEALRRLPREEAPPPELESQIAAMLPARRRVRFPGGVFPLATAAALAAVFFGLGFFAATRQWFASATPEKRFVLLVRESPATGGPSRVREYSRWARELAGQGRLDGGAKLTAGGLLVSAGETKPATFRESGDVGGFFIINAAGIEEATRIALTCPHIQYGGTLELRPVDQ